MANVNLYNQSGVKKGSVTLDDSVFAAGFNEPLVHQVIVAQQNAKRQGTKSTLTRTEVRGGGIKPWRQKGTGRARQGSIRSPQWDGGGVVFAPKPRDFSQKINKQQKRAALVCALSDKVAKDKLLVLDEIKLAEAKTKEMAAVFEAFKLNIKTHIATDAEGKQVEKESKALPKILLIVEGESESVVRAAKNIPYVKTIPSAQVNVYDLIASDK
ncbi:MAG: 50S ribosomal protein L4, partial [Firmicutes bacterium]|nr:50S ribosomal protein L4 [Bacillota bacterium]